MSVSLRVGDCVEIMPTMPEAGVDAIVTDPPYGLEFMGKEWDKLDEIDSSRETAGFSSPGIGQRNIPRPSFGGEASNPTCETCGGRKRGAKQCNCQHPEWRFKGLPIDLAAAAAERGRKMQQWHETWARAALRVLKPGGHLVAFGGTRTHHRLACAVEDAGFEVRDCLMWLYGQGFPKSLGISKAIGKSAGAERSEIAKQWEGWGTALKPAWEPIILCRKPLGEKNVAANVLRHGTGGINVDGCRISTTPEEREQMLKMSEGFVGRKCGRPELANYGYEKSMPDKTLSTPNSQGRWPANVVLSHAGGCVLVGMRRVRAITGTRAGGQQEGIIAQAPRGDGRATGYGDAVGMETVEDWRCVEGCPIRMLDEQSGTLKSGFMRADQRRSENRDGGYHGGFPKDRVGARDTFGDSGGASRFFYCAKASRAERGEGNNHPTVKPVAVMRWLIRLVTPPSGLVLDPFVGSGTTLVAAKEEGVRAIGIECDRDYARIAARRAGTALREPVVVREPVL
jgi:DNA modification methylase